jgi:hypothetical protein
VETTGGVSTNDTKRKLRDTFLEELSVSRSERAREDLETLRLRSSKIWKGATGLDFLEPSLIILKSEEEKLRSMLFADQQIIITQQPQHSEASVCRARDGEVYYIAISNNVEDPVIAHELFHAYLEKSILGMV